MDFLRRYTPTQLVVLAGVILLILYQLSPGFARDPLEWVLRVAGILLAITVHEFNHAFVADLLGDPTPRSMGRVSLNPIRHLDPLGTMLILFGPFGWGRPVMFNPGRLRVEPRLGSAAVSAAGPVANLVTAAVLGLPLREQWAVDGTLAVVLLVLVYVNVGLAIFNLIPLPPLDGSGLLLGILPRSIAGLLVPVYNLGPFLLVVLLIMPSFGGPNILFQVIGPVFSEVVSLIIGI